MRPDSARPEESIFDFSPSTVTRRMKEAAQAAGIDSTSISCHSPRVGMAQDLAAWGIDLPDLMLACRWNSAETAGRYIRHLVAHYALAAEYLKTQPPRLICFSVPDRYDALPIPV